MIEDKREEEEKEEVGMYELYEDQVSAPMKIKPLEMGDVCKFN